MSTIKTREIKFRQKTKDSWHFWGYIGNDFISPMNGIKESMQYTGLLDKNDKEIYEGDLFGKMGGDIERPDEYEMHARVYFDVDLASFVVDAFNGGWQYLDVYLRDRTTSREVIGNVHENPELIANKPE